MNASPPPPANLDELSAQAARYLGHHIWTETVSDRTRYVARSRDLTSHPYLVVTDNLDEIWAELAQGRPDGQDDTPDLDPSTQSATT